TGHRCGWSTARRRGWRVGGLWTNGETVFQRGDALVSPEPRLFRAAVVGAASPSFRLRLGDRWRRLLGCNRKDCKATERGVRADNRWEPSRESCYNHRCLRRRRSPTIFLQPRGDAAMLVAVSSGVPREDGRSLRNRVGRRVQVNSVVVRQHAVVEAEMMRNEHEMGDREQLSAQQPGGCERGQKADQYPGADCSHR
ncbi:MAG TPA: hypothetical protein VGJ84_16710, partial [Polyangiaceae bacterium]